MAQAMRCDMCGAENAQVMQQNLENGDVLMIGPSCQIIFHLTVAAEMLAMLPEANLVAYLEVLTPVTAKLMALDANAAELADLADLADGGGALADGAAAEAVSAHKPPRRRTGAASAEETGRGADATIPPGGAHSDARRAGGVSAASNG